jgi:hypothetical protein
MVDFFFAHGEDVSRSARVFRTSLRTVVKWAKRYKAQGWQGLRDSSRRPHHSPHGTPKHQQQLIVRLTTHDGRRPRTGIEQDKPFDKLRAASNFSSNNGMASRSHPPPSTGYFMNSSSSAPERRSIRRNVR